MILSRVQLEEIAAAVTDDFNCFFFGVPPEMEREDILPTPIDQLAREYLGLEVVFAPLSSDGSICGLTSYANTSFTIETNGGPREYTLKENQVILDKRFIQPGQVKKLCGKRRFTLAHECAHQILFQLESDEIKSRWKNAYATRKAYSVRDLKTKEDWNEWQANVLGAALLMPCREIELAMGAFAEERILKNYGGRFSFLDERVLALLCQTFGVSRTAIIIRLRELGYLEDHPYHDFCEPLLRRTGA